MQAYRSIERTNERASERRDEAFMAARGNTSASCPTLRMYVRYLAGITYETYHFARIHAACNARLRVSPPRREIISFAAANAKKKNERGGTRHLGVFRDYV